MGIDGDIDAFRATLQRNKERLDILTDFILSNLVEGVDYGRVPLNRNRTLMSKPILLQPGAEKIMTYLGWRVSYRDNYEADGTFNHSASQGGSLNVSAAWEV